MLLPLLKVSRQQEGGKSEGPPLSRPFCHLVAVLLIMNFVKPNLNKLFEFH